MWLCTTMSVGRSRSALNVWNARSIASRSFASATRRDVPAVRHEPRRDILGEGDVRVALDGHAVRVVDPAEVREPLVRLRAMPPRTRRPPSCSRHRRARRRRSRRSGSPRGCSGRRATAQPIAMPTDVATPWPSGPVVVSTPLVQRYSGWPGHCESSWRKRLQVVERDRGLARGSRTRDRPACTPVRCSSDHSSVDAWPSDSTNRSRFGQIGSCGIEPHHSLPQRVGDGRDAHRRAWMARVRLLDRVHAERADRVDGQRVQVGRHERLPSAGRSTMPHEWGVGLRARSTWTRMSRRYERGPRLPSSDADDASVERRYAGAAMSGPSTTSTCAPWMSATGGGVGIGCTASAGAPSEAATAWASAWKPSV